MSFRQACVDALDKRTCANGLWLTNYALSDLSPQTTLVGRRVFGNGLVVEYHYVRLTSAPYSGPRKLDTVFG